MVPFDMQGFPIQDAQLLEYLKSIFPFWGQNSNILKMVNFWILAPKWTPGQKNRASLHFLNYIMHRLSCHFCGRHCYEREELRGWVINPAIFKTNCFSIFFWSIPRQGSLLLVTQYLLEVCNFPFDVSWMVCLSVILL